MADEQQASLNFDEWKDTVPTIIKEGPLWKLLFYQKALFLYEVCWADCDAWLQKSRGVPLVNQIVRSSGSISANIEEGYGRGFGRDYARFLSIAVASARETQGWYLRARHLMKPIVLEHRLRMCDEVIALLVPVIKQQRSYADKK
jgi:four helix bundle protein